LYNVRKGKLEPDFLDALNIKSNLFPAPALATAIAGTVSVEAAAKLGLLQGTPVIAGSSDGTTAMYGAGVLDEGTAALVSGTTDVVMMCAASAPRHINHALCLNSGMVPRSYLIGGPLGLSGGTLQYFERLLQTSASGLEQKIDALPPGSNGLIVLPGLTGERSPYWKEHLTGTITGLTPDHKSQHFLRAVMEGCVLRMLGLLDILSQNRLQPKALNVAGGGTNIDVWNQIRSDASGLEVRKLAVTEATSLGTALFCKAGLDKNRSLKEIAGEWIGVDKRFKPDKKRTGIYKQLARRFEAQIKFSSNLYLAQRKILKKKANAS
jgi:sugar (pentulose or hexulose) kinase